MTKRSQRRNKPANANKKAADPGEPAAQSHSQPARPAPQVEQTESVAGSKLVAESDKRSENAAKTRPKTEEVETNPMVERTAVVMDRLANLFAGISGDLVAQMARGKPRGEPADESSEMAAVDRAVERAVERAVKPTVEPRFELEDKREGRRRTRLQDIPIWRLSPRRHPHRYASHLLAGNRARLLRARKLIKRFHRTFARLSPYPAHLHARILAFLTTQLCFWEEAVKQLVLYLPAVLHVTDGDAAGTVLLSKSLQELMTMGEDPLVSERERRNAESVVRDRVLCWTMAAWVKGLLLFYGHRMLEEQGRWLDVELEAIRGGEVAAKDAQTIEVDGILRDLAKDFVGKSRRSRAADRGLKDVAEGRLMGEIGQVFKKLRRGAVVKVAEPDTKDTRDVQWLSDRQIRVRETKTWLSRMEREQDLHELRELPKRLTMLRIAGGVEGWAKAEEKTEGNLGNDTE